MAEEAKTFPTVGYDKHGRPNTFNLKPGEKLPAGYADRPPPGTHPVEGGPKPEPEAPRKPAA